MWDLERGLEPAGVVCRGLRRRCDVSLEASAEARFLAMVSVNLGIADGWLELELRLDGSVVQDQATFVVISGSVLGIIEELILTIHWQSPCAKSACQFWSWSSV